MQRTRCLVLQKQGFIVLSLLLLVVVLSILAQGIIYIVKQQAKTQQEYIRHTGITKDKLEQLRSPCDQIDLEKVIFPWIKFNSPILQNVLKEMKQLHNVSPGRKGYENTFVFGDMKITVGVGGIHGDCGIEIIKPKENELLLGKYMKKGGE